jgi:DNA polymerase/3'-5' exonuclease PolX
MKLSRADQIAERLVREMRPYCERIEIAGSVRRRKVEVKDIEIVAVPKWDVPPVEEQVRLLFGSPPRSANANTLHFWAMKLAGVRWIKPGTSQIVAWTPRPEGKYWRGLVPTSGDDPIKLDLFLAEPENFGLIYLIRTGAAEFSAAILGHAKNRTSYQTEKSYYEDRPELKGKPEGGWLVEKATGRRIEVRDERDVFELLGLQFVEPPLRIDGRAIRRKS